MLLQENSPLRKLTPPDIIRELWRRGDLGYKLHSSQQDYRRFFSETGYIKNMLHCGRGWGKTWNFLAMCCEYAIKNPNSRIVYATKSRESVQQIVLPTYKLFTQDVPKDVLPQWKVQGHCFEFSNGSVIVLEGADDDHGNKLRGAFAHLVICDEFGFWSHAEYVANHILLPQVQRVGGKMFFTSTTPESTGHEFYQFVSECKKNGTYFKKTIYDNPRLNESEIEKYIEQCGGRNEAGELTTMFRREYLCEDVVEETRAVIPEFKPRHVIKECLPPRFRDVYISADFAFVKDFTHVLFAYYDFPLAKLVIEDELCLFNDVNITTQAVSEKIRTKRKDIWSVDGNELLPFMSVADCPPQVLFDLHVSNGLEFFSPPKYDKEQAINELREAFRQDRILVSSKCTHLIDQLTRGIWNQRRSDYERLPGLGHLDGVDACIYLWRVLDRNRNPVPRYVNAPMNNIHQFNEHMYKDNHSLDRLSDLYE